MLPTNFVVHTPKSWGNITLNLRGNNILKEKEKTRKENFSKPIAKKYFTDIIYNMNVDFNNISFRHLVSTPLLLRAGSGAIKFDEAKLLNNELGVKYSGLVSFYKRALDIAKRAAREDSRLAKIFEELKNTPKENFESKISSYTSELGEKIDINV